MSGVCSVSRLPLVVILGATGAGKSKLALEIAVKYNGEIISADSMQVYKKLDIITNKVSPTERRMCPHHLIDCVSPLNVSYNVVNFRNAALPIIDGFFTRNKMPIVVGGTNYYIESLLWDLLIDSDNEEKQKETVGSVLPPGECGKEQAQPQPPSECNQKQSSECERSQAKKMKLSPDKAFNRESLQKESSESLHRMLSEVDPDRAKQLHPNDRRKILRSLEVFYTEGRRMSDYLQEQHSGRDGVSGRLRFPNPCVIWVQAEQSVLDSRTDKRVDEMIDQGLIREMLDFHSDYNQDRLQENKQADYTLGIFQSIGFKEFHDYLIMSEEDRSSESGQTALQKGIEDMKRATRQYARKQTKWMTNRFLKRRGGNVPSVYAVDSTDPSQWQQSVYEPAASVVEAFIQGMNPDVEPLPVEVNDNTPVYKICEVCNLVLLTTKQCEAHMKGHRHKRNLKHLNRQLKKDQETIDDIGPSQAISDVQPEQEQQSICGTAQLENPPTQLETSHEHLCDVQLHDKNEDVKSDEVQNITESVKLPT